MASVNNHARRRRPSSDNKSRIRRVGADRLADVAAETRAALPTLLDFTNAEQFDAIDDAVALLFYTETDDGSEEVLFDPDNDAALFDLHTRPFSFTNAESLPAYEALTERARYYCKPHPNQALARAQAALELGAPVNEDLLIMVYKRDSAAESLVKLRTKTPFRNPVNGVGHETPLVLYRQYSYDPFASVRLLWHREAHINALVGLVGFSVETLYG